MVLSLTIILLAIVSSYIRYRNTLSDYIWLNHSLVVIQEIAELKSSVYEMESQGRAYLLTGDSAFKSGIESSHKESLTQWKIVDSLISDNDQQRILCDKLLPLIDGRYTILESSIHSPGNDSLVRQNIRTTHVIMHQLITLMNQMVDVEYKLGDERAKTARNSIVLAPVFLLCASVVSFLCIVFAYIMLVKAYSRANTLRNQLAQNVRTLNQSNKELEQFAYIASHDLQEPLRKLRAFTGMLLTNEDKHLSEEGKGLLKRMEFSGARMHRLIEDLLMFSRMVNVPADPVVVDLNTIVNDIIQEVKENNKNRNIIVHVDKLPVIKGYATQLIQLFQNIINNSVKYSKPSGDIEIHIGNSMVKGASIQAAIPSERQKMFYQVTVSDNGIGFEQQYAQKIFNIFQRLHGRSEYEGTGIGLAICKKVVENHHGYIKAEGQMDKGATIYIYLPEK